MANPDLSQQPRTPAQCRAYRLSQQPLKWGEASWSKADATPWCFTLRNADGFHLAVVYRAKDDDGNLLPGWMASTWDFAKDNFIVDDASPYDTVEQAQAVAEATLLLGA